jgi:methylmalonyl-CoA/ethylmalonyl-CoA epimerase
MTVIRRLDHVAIAIADSREAVRRYADDLGLVVVHQEELREPPVRLTYIDAGNCFLQLVEPLGPGELADWLAANGEGLHHLCFGVDDVAAAAAALGDGSAVRMGSGRGRPSAFVPGSPDGVRLECTQFERGEDVDGRAGWLPPS